MLRKSTELAYNRRFHQDCKRFLRSSTEDDSCLSTIPKYSEQHIRQLENQPYTDDISFKLINGRLFPRN